MLDLTGGPLFGDHVVRLPTYAMNQMHTTLALATFFPLLFENIVLGDDQCRMIMCSLLCYKNKIS